jgi:hypothetical protein
MYREQFLKSGIVSVGLLVCAFFWNEGVVRAQSPEAPLLPMNVEFRYVPKYFEQRISGDLLYTRIQALVDEDGCDVILLEKSTNREAFYSFSKRRVDAQAANGRDAYITPIGFTALSTNSSPAFVIHFQDRFGNEIIWKFAVGEIVPHASPKVISGTSNSSIIFLYAPFRAPSVAGTTLTIAGREYTPESTQSDDGLAAFYATDMTIGQILPGTDFWAVESSPADLVQTAKWNLGGDGGRLRTLAVKELSSTEASIEQFDVNHPDAPHVILNLVRVNDAYELSSLSCESHFNTLWIFFSPSLPLPAQKIDDKRVVTFTVAENEQANIASGILDVQRAVGAEHVLWRFETPSFARGITLETGVNSISNAGTQATCTNKVCSDLLR